MAKKTKISYNKRLYNKLDKGQDATPEWTEFIHAVDDLKHVAMDLDEAREDLAEAKRCITRAKKDLPKAKKRVAKAERDYTKARTESKKKARKGVAIKASIGPIFALAETPAPRSGCTMNYPHIIQTE